MDYEKCLKIGLTVLLWSALYAVSFEMTGYKVGIFIPVTALMIIDVVIQVPQKKPTVGIIRLTLIMSLVILIAVADLFIHYAKKAIGIEPDRSRTSIDDIQDLIVDIDTKMEFYIATAMFIGAMCHSVLIPALLLSVLIILEKHIVRYDIEEDEAEEDDD